MDNSGDFSGRDSYYYPNTVEFSVHDTGKLPAKMYKISPGFKYDIRITVKNYTRLPKPYKGQCIEDWPQEIDQNLVKFWDPPLEKCKLVCAMINLYQV